MTRRCGHKTVDGFRFYFPECWGGLYKKSGCYCPMPATIKSRIKELKSEIADLQYELDAEFIDPVKQN